MTSETTRSLQAVGGQKASLNVTLPKDWIKFWNLKKGDKTAVLYDGCVIIVPENQRKKIKKKLMNLVIW